MEIWKYTIGNFEGMTLELPIGSKFLDVQVQGGAAVMWFQVTPATVPETRRFVVHGTGHHVPGDRTYLGTFQMPPYVWHLFELT